MAPRPFKRKCVDPFCTNTESSNKSFFRFPKDLSRRQLWFKKLSIVYVDNPYILVCSDHFAEKDFTSTQRNRLSKFAVPLDSNAICEEDLIDLPPSALNLPSVPSTSSFLTPINKSSFRTPSTSDFILPRNQNSSGLKLANVPSTSASLKPINSSPSIPSTSDFLLSINQKSSGLLQDLNVTRATKLSPRKKLLYDSNKKLKKKIVHLNSKLRKSKRKMAVKLCHSEMLKSATSNLSPIIRKYFTNSFKNAQALKRNWDVSDKVFGLALFKKGPRCYRFLSSHIPMPSLRTINRLLDSIPFQPGLNTELLSKLGKRVSKMARVDKICTLMFDEMSLSRQMTYDKKHDKVVGYVDLGTLGRFNEEADHALVFMVQGVCKRWKQPIAYYFTKSQVKTDCLKFLLVELIGALQNIGLNVRATVCDLGTTNTSAINQLVQKSSDPFFIVNGKKVFTLFDPPHLLKCTRNALYKYDIQFGEGLHQIAKWSHIRGCFEIDKKKRFQALRKIREVYLDFERNSRLKMKVSVAAKVLSYTMSAAIETCISTNASEVNKLPAAAMYTAEFIADIDSLFDSFNGNGPNRDSGKTYRIAMSDKSPHRLLWERLLPMIKRLKFLPPSRGPKNLKTIMPFKKGWITTIEGTLKLWETCSKIKGFKFLRTKSLNQDPLENTFGSIRSYGAANKTPNCYQFTSGFKTSILNNLIDNSRGKNCEKDDGRILDNLQDFVEPTEILAEPLVEINCDFDHVKPPASMQRDIYDDNTAMYVAGWLIKKINANACELCSKSLLSEDEQVFHTFTSFKEYTDGKKRLHRGTEELLELFILIHDCVISILPNYGHVCHLLKKFKLYFDHHYDFSPFPCPKHLNNLLEYSIILIIRKYYDDMYRASKL